VVIKYYTVDGKKAGGPRLTLFSGRLEVPEESEKIK